MNRAAQGIVCAFGELAEGIGGFAWDLGDPGALLLRDGTAQPATFALEESGDAATVTLTAGESTLEATLAPRDAALALAPGDGESGGELTMTACTAEMRSEGETRTARGTGWISRWVTEDPLSGAAAYRCLTVEREESLLVATARGEPGAEGHGQERTLGWMLSGEHVTPFEEALISTQYGADGDPTRLGLELWPRDADHTSRAAATRIAGSALGGVRTDGTWAGFFRCHTDGSEGLGTYLLWRA